MMDLVTDNFWITFEISTITPDTDVGTTALDDSDVSIYRKIAYVTVPLLLVVGLVGNSVSVCVMLQPAFRKHNIRYFIAAMAVCDNFNLVIQLFKMRFFVAWLPTDHRDSSLALCKTFFFFAHFFKYTSGFCISVIAIERFVAVRFPFRAKEWLKTRNLFKLAAIVFGVLITPLVYKVMDAAQISNGKCDSNTRESNLVVLIISK